MSHKKARGQKLKEENQRWHEEQESRRKAAATAASLQRKPVDGLAPVPLPSLDEELAEIDARGARFVVNQPRPIPPPKASLVPGSPADYQRHIQEPITKKDEVQQLQDEKTVRIEPLKFCQSCRKEKPKSQFPSGKGFFKCDECREIHGKRSGDYKAAVDRNLELAEKGQKHCPRCDRDLDREAFNKNTTKSDGRQAICRECQSDIWTVGSTESRRQQGAEPPTEASAEPPVEPESIALSTTVYAPPAPTLPGLIVKLRAERDQLRQERDQAFLDRDQARAELAQVYAELQEVLG